jgi:predicted DNA binding CopG/RHH family protein
MKSKKINRKAGSFLSEEDIKPENVKWNITIRMPGDLIEAYRREAAKLGIGYQTLMQLKLREGIDNSLTKRIEAIEKRLKGA